MPMRTRARTSGFGLADLLVTVAAISLLAAIVAPTIRGIRSRSALNQCVSNLQRVSRAVLMYANDNEQSLPSLEKTPQSGVWWWYKEQVKKYAGAHGQIFSK